MSPARKSLWHVRGLDALRLPVGEYFWAYSSTEAKKAWATKYGAIPSSCEFIK
jgi:hypothetical protein